MAANALPLNVFCLSGAMAQGFATLARLQLGRMMGAGGRAILDRVASQVAGLGVGGSILGRRPWKQGV